MPAPRGNRNAVKPAEDRRSERIVIRCKASEKDALIDAAQECGKPLSRWVLDSLPIGASQDRKRPNKSS